LQQNIKSRQAGNFVREIKLPKNYTPKPLAKGQKEGVYQLTLAPSYSTDVIISTNLQQN